MKSDTVQTISLGCLTLLQLRKKRSSTLYGRAWKTVQGKFSEDHSHCGAKDVDVAIEGQDSGIMHGTVSQNLDLFVFEMRQNFSQRARQKYSVFSIHRQCSVIDRAGSTLGL